MFAAAQGQVEADGGRIRCLAGLLIVCADELEACSEERCTLWKRVVPESWFDG